MQPVAYMVSRFPKITETFVLDEVVGLQRRGSTVLVYSLLATDEDVQHPAAADVRNATTYGSRNAWTLLLAQVAWTRRAPLVMLRLWLRVLTQNTSSVGEWGKSVVTTLVAAEWALQLAPVGIARIHAHWATHPALAAYVAGHLLGVPYGFTAHAHDLYGENGMLREKLSAADLVVTISEYNRRLLRRRFGALADDVLLLHCGVDRDQFTPSPTPERQDDTLRLLCVASLSDYKGHRYLLDALELLLERGVQVRCSLVGDGPLRADLEARASGPALRGSVELLGRRTAPEVRRLLRECDAFVLPSVPADGGMMEGIPVAIMEAMATGRPVVASALSGVPELVEDGVTGLLVQPRDAPGLAAALERLHASPALRRRMGAAGPDVIGRAFDQGQNVALLQGWLHDASSRPTGVD